MQLALLMLAAFFAATAAHSEPLACTDANLTSNDWFGQRQLLPFPETIKEDFQFELRNMYTARQFGARYNAFVKYRYYTPAVVDCYTTENGSFDYQGAKDVVLQYMSLNESGDGMDGIEPGTYWEIVNRELAKAIWSKFAIQGLSVMIQIQGMSSGGIASHRASTVTVGDIEPWASVPAQFPGCDGMDTGAGNEACVIAITGFNATEPIPEEALAAQGHLPAAATQLPG